MPAGQAIRGAKSRGAPLDPNSAKALLALYQQGRTTEALAQGEALASQHPDVAFLHNIVGACHAAQGRAEDAAAAYRRALALQPGSAELRNNLGNALNLLGRHTEAVEELNRAIAIRPDYPEALRNLGNAHFDLQQYDEAAEALGKVVLIQPENVPALFNLGIVLVMTGRSEEAIRRFRETIALDPSHAGAHNNLGKMLTATGKTEAAIAALRQALALCPDFPDALINLGQALSNDGAFEEARTCYRKAIELHPGGGEAHSRLCAMQRATRDDPLIAEMEHRLAEAETAEDRMHFHFALAKAHDDFDATDEAFRHLQEGNRLGREAEPFSLEAERSLFERIKTIFGNIPEPLTMEDIGEAKVRPIFIVGMPRSGTSLTEQILASHSEVHGAGELSHMQWATAPLVREAPARIDADDLRRVRETYLAKIEALGAGKPAVIDKMPANFRSIGFVAAAFPDATIIHTRRDPVAVGWSIYRTFLPAKGVSYSFDLADIAAYYRLYENLMAFWAENLPGRIHDLDYERLTENQEDETRRLLEHCGLAWDDNCLAFHNAKRSVRTASAQQVREKMYTGSSDAWRKYEKHLGPLIEGLA